MYQQEIEKEAKIERYNEKLDSIENLLKSLMKLQVFPLKSLLIGKVFKASKI